MNQHVNTQALEQGTQAWLDARMGMITASRVGAILGVSPFGKREDTLREMVRETLGAEREFTGNVATTWGSKFEDEARQAYEAHTGSLVIETGMHVHPNINYLAASPDGLVDENGLVEIKCPYSLKKFSIKDREDYWHQIQLQLHCTGRTWCDFVVYHPESNQSEEWLQIERVDIDPQWTMTHMQALSDFMDDYLDAISDEDLQKAHLEPLVVDMNAEDAWLAAAAELRRIKADMGELKRAEDKAKAELIELAKGRRCDGAGVQVYPTRRTTVDWKQATAGLDLDLAKFERVNTSMTVKVK